MKILVGLDRSAVAQDALATAIDYAQKLDGEIILASSMIGGLEIPREVFVKKETLLELGERLVRNADLQCETEFSSRGLEAGEDLVQLAHEKGVDLIVVGVRRRSKVGKMLFGSTAQFVILNAPCPVLTIT